jgi:hypothetical protein
MTDRELLERAAMAAGLTIEYWAQDDYPVVRDGTAQVGWNPLKFDSDALRLAVRLGLVVDTSRPSAALPFQQQAFAQADYTDLYAATRRAIVRAAAATLKD